jgi:tripartite-type tricarboxylate transporter receptor subunit TctC
MHWTSLMIGAAVALGVAGAAVADDWPTRAIENSVWASAGGGTDFTNRLVSAAMEEHLGVTVNVVNRTGGGGGVAMHHVWSRDHDGYHWLGASEQMQNVAVMGFHETTTRDWHWYMIGGSPGSIAVRGDSPYETIDDFIEAALADPGGIRIGHCATGCVWHLKAESLITATDTDINNIPFEGSAPAMVAAITGEVEAVVSSIQEQSEYIRAGELRSLGMIEMEPFEFPGVGTIEGLGERFPRIAEMPARQWLGIAVPGDIPDERRERIDAAFDAAMASDEVRERLSGNFLQVMGHRAEDSQRILQELESAVSWALWDLGIAEISPEEFDIAKP